MMTAHTSAPHHMVAASITFLLLRIIASNLINTTGSRRRSPCRTLRTSPTHRITPPRHTKPHRRRTTSHHHMDTNKINSTRISILDLQYLQFGTPPRPAPPPPTTPRPPGTTSSSNASSASRLVSETNHPL